MLRVVIDVERQYSAEQIAESVRWRGGGQMAGRTGASAPAATGNTYIHSLAKAHEATAMAGPRSSHLHNVTLGMGTFVERRLCKGLKWALCVVDENVASRQSAPQHSSGGLNNTPKELSEMPFLFGRLAGKQQHAQLSPCGDGATQIRNRNRNRNWNSYSYSCSYSWAKFENLPRHWHHKKGAKQGYRVMMMMTLDRVVE